MGHKRKKKKAAAHKTHKRAPPPSIPNPIHTEAAGLLIFTSAIIVLFSLFSFAFGDSRNWFGLMGTHIGWLFSSLFGIGGYFLCIYVGWVGWRMLFNRSIHHPIMETYAAAAGILSICMLLSLTEDRFPTIAHAIGSVLLPQQWLHNIRYHLGGTPFFFLYKDLPTYNMFYVLNGYGVALVFTATLLASLLYLTKVRPSQVFAALSQWYKEVIQHLKKPQPVENLSDPLRFVKLKTSSKAEHTPEMMQITPKRELKERPSLSKKDYADRSSTLFDKEAKREPFGGVTGAEPPPPVSTRIRALQTQQVYNGDFEKYRLPPATLLTTPAKVDLSSLKKNLRRQAEVLEETLMSFGIEAKVGQVNCGPTITSFEVHPSIGVKVQKIKSLENDIALNMEAKSIRIIAPIPGKAAVGIEVPNPQPQEVGFKEILAAYKQEERHYHVPLLLGKTVNGDFVMNDLTKMPHCIIAGATGSGKSVCINTIVMSILMNARPDEIKLIMIDPKKVELTPYSALPHMLAPVITEPQGACAALNWLVKEMETRYEILKRVGVRNIEGFNSREPNLEFEVALGIDIPKKMPYIVGIIDELADLMMVSSSDIETPIARIAQMARAVGIHLVLATQRPSREVITGLIKANFPVRISFKVASRVNSQIVLDELGAEALLGNGDMLFLPPGASHLIRAQGAYIRDGDINGVVQFICEQAPPNYVIHSFDSISPLCGFDGEEPADGLYRDAYNVVIGTGNASTTFLQRKLKLGYARAASLIDELEKRGVISAPEGNKPRKVLVANKGDDPSDGYEHTNLQFP